MHLVTTFNYKGTAALMVTLIINPKFWPFEITQTALHVEQAKGGLKVVVTSPERHQTAHRYS